MGLRRDDVCKCDISVLAPGGLAVDTSKLLSDWNCDETERNIAIEI